MSYSLPSPTVKIALFDNEFRNSCICGLQFLLCIDSLWLYEDTENKTQDHKPYPAKTSDRTFIEATA